MKIEYFTDVYCEATKENFDRLAKSGVHWECYPKLGIKYLRYFIIENNILKASWNKKGTKLKYSALNGFEI